MDKHIKILNDILMEPFFQASQHKCFLTQQEYEANIGKINIIKDCLEKVTEKMIIIE